MSWELSYLHTLQNFSNPIIDKIMVLLSMLGNAGVIWILAAVILLISKKYRKTGIQMIAAMLITFIIGNLILKNVIHRPRPYVVDPTIIPKVVKPSEFSFPSGHTMNGVTASLTIFLRDKRLGIAAIVLALLIAFSRIYNLVHFPTDVIGGIVIGICSAILVEWYVMRKEKAN